MTNHLLNGEPQHKACMTAGTESREEGVSPTGNPQQRLTLRVADATRSVIILILGLQ